MNDYTWPSVFFSYFFFALSLALAVFFFIRSWRDGYWGKHSEDVKWRVFDEPQVGQTIDFRGLPSARSAPANAPLPDGRGSVTRLAQSRDREGAEGPAKRNS
jgi:hypothetical protein